MSESNITSRMAVVAMINAKEKHLSTLTDEELKAKTEELRVELANATKTRTGS